MLIEAQIAKIEARLVELQGQAQKILERGAEPRGIVTESGAAPLVISLTVDLHKVDPGLFHLVADRFVEIVTEVRAGVAQAQDLRSQLSTLRSSAPMHVQVSFG